MKIDQVPQHYTHSLNGHQKRVYAQDQQGQYQPVLTSGWDVEEIVLEQAIAEFDQLARQARKRIKLGLSSPLEYHMHHHRMDVAMLAQCTGFFKWQVRRHLQPKYFLRLSRQQIQRYMDAFNLDIAELQSLPDELA
ncbi:MAG: helix-turn-helix domain-containing protein [Parahaliea sp.]